MRGSAAAMSVVACAILLAGCGGDDAASTELEAQPPSPTVATPRQSASPTTSSPAMTSLLTTSSPTAASGTTITLAESQFGDVLFDGTGQAIYYFDIEDSSTPECYEGCAEAWPPVLTNGAPVAAPGVSQELLDTTARTDGGTQVTYAGRPLYFYAHEGKNVVLCHDVFEFGGRWLAVTGSGDPVPQ